MDPRDASSPAGDGGPGDGAPPPGAPVGTLPEGRAVPAWRRVTDGEQRWAVTVALLVAVALQWALPARLGIRPHWLLPGLELLLMVVLAWVNPNGAPVRPHRPRRVLSLALTAAVSVANGWSAALLVYELLDGHGTGSKQVSAVALLMTGGGVWLTNIIAFSLWYWEYDRGGPAERALGRNYPDFLFPQMQQQGIAPPDWEPAYLDYLYVAFTGATAFSPTDTMPLSRWAKLLMALQSVISLTTLSLVVARAVNVLP